VVCVCMRSLRACLCARVCVCEFALVFFCMCLCVCVCSLPQILVQKIYIGTVRGRISSRLNYCLQESLILDFVIIQIIRLCIFKISVLCGEFPQKIIPYVTTECTYQ
jgi:hypothetical protein